jgi:hypothetical protein
MMEFPRQKLALERAGAAAARRNAKIIREQVYQNQKNNRSIGTIAPNVKSRNRGAGRAASP